MFRYCYFSVLKGCHSHYYTYSHHLHHFWSSNREIKRKHQNLKQFLIISINIRLFVNHCASTVYKIYIHVYGRRPWESIQLNFEQRVLILNDGDFDKESTTQRPNSRAPGVNLVCGKATTLKPKCSNLQGNSTHQLLHNVRVQRSSRGPRDRPVLESCIATSRRQMRHARFAGGVQLPDAAYRHPSRQNIVQLGIGRSVVTCYKKC